MRHVDPKGGLKQPRTFLVGVVVIVSLHALVIIMIGLLAFLIPPQVVQEAFPLSFGPPLDWNNSIALSVSFDNPPYLKGEVLFSSTIGQGRIQNLESLDFLGCYLWLCGSPLPPPPVAVAYITNNCNITAVYPNDVPRSPLFQGQMAYQGSYNFNFSVVVSPIVSIAVAHPTKDRVLGAAAVVGFPFGMSFYIFSSFQLLTSRRRCQCFIWDCIRGCR
jgi:hypothetical protein